MDVTLFRVFSLIALLLIDPHAAGADQGMSPASRNAEYTITVIPYYSPEKLWSRFAPFVDYLRKRTGLPWNLKLYPNHETLLDALCTGKVSLALLGPVPLGRVVDRCNAEIVAVAIGKDGKPFYRSVVLTGDPGVKTLSDFRGKRFALFKGSTAAHIYPLKMLADADLPKDGIVPVFLESQDRIINALLGREVSGAGVKDSLYRKFKREQLRVLKISDPLPGFAFAAAPKLREAIKARFAEALMKLRPLAVASDAGITQYWDDEIKNGFIAPPADYRSSVMSVLSVYKEIAHEAR